MYTANNYKGHYWFSCLLNLMHDANLVPLDGPATLVPTHQAVWRLPGTQGRLVHLWVKIFEQEICWMFPQGWAQITAFCPRKLAEAKPSFCSLLVITLSNLKPAILREGGSLGKFRLIWMWAKQLWFICFISEPTVDQNWQRTGCDQKFVPSANTILTSWPLTRQARIDFWKGDNKIICITFKRLFLIYLWVWKPRPVQPSSRG